MECPQCSEPGFSIKQGCAECKHGQKSSATAHEMYYWATCASPVDKYGQDRQCDRMCKSRQPFTAQWFCFEHCEDVAREND